MEASHETHHFVPSPHGDNLVEDVKLTFHANGRRTFVPNEEREAESLLERDFILEE